MGGGERGEVEREKGKGGEQQSDSICCMERRRGEAGVLQK